jgi:hypothetical protein
MNWIHNYLEELINFNNIAIIIWYKNYNESI